MRIVHKVKHVSERGASALCSPKPRAINMKTSTWTLADSAVTCHRCLMKLKELKAAQ